MKEMIDLIIKAYNSLKYDLPILMDETALYFAHNIKPRTAHIHLITNFDTLIEIVEHMERTISSFRITDIKFECAGTTRTVRVKYDGKFFRLFVYVIPKVNTFIYDGVPIADTHIIFQHLLMKAFKSPSEINMYYAISSLKALENWLTPMEIQLLCTFLSETSDLGDLLSEEDREVIRDALQFYKLILEDFIYIEDISRLDVPIVACV